MYIYSCCNVCRWVKIWSSIRKICTKTIERATAAIKLWAVAKKNNNSLFGRFKKEYIECKHGNCISWQLRTQCEGKQALKKNRFGTTLKTNICLEQI